MQSVDITSENREVYGIRLPENAASGRVPEKCGFHILNEE